MKNCQKRGIILTKLYREISSLFKYVGLILKIYYEFQVNMFSKYILGVLKKINNNNNFTQNYKSKKRHNSFKKKMILELSPLFVHIPLFIVSIYFGFQLYMFCNGRDMPKCQQFLHNHNINAKATAIPTVFSENSRAKKDIICLGKCRKNCSKKKIYWFFSHPALFSKTN